VYGKHQTLCKQYQYMPPHHWMISVGIGFIHARHSYTIDYIYYSSYQCLYHAGQLRMY